MTSLIVFLILASRVFYLFRKYFIMILPTFFKYQSNLIIIKFHLHFVYQSTFKVRLSENLVNNFFILILLDFFLFHFHIQHWSRLINSWFQFSPFLIKQFNFEIVTSLIVFLILASRAFYLFRKYFIMILAIFFKYQSNLIIINFHLHFVYHSTFKVRIPENLVNN